MLGWPTPPVRDLYGVGDLVTDGSVSPSAEVRQACSDEFDRLRWIESESDRLLATIGIGPFTDDDEERRFRATVVFASGDPAVGFVSVVLVDGDAHIAQLSVLPEVGRQGIGRSLLDEAIHWARYQGLVGVTLTTFRDVPWNAPFYAKVGFMEVINPTPGLAAIRKNEHERGIDAMGSRLAMRLAI